MLGDADRSQKRYHEVSDNVDRQYASLERIAGTRTDREMQVFWANLEVLRPSVYGRAPVPVVSARFRDRKQLPRRAADLLERALLADIEVDDLHDTLLSVRDDLCANARGVAWLRIGDRDGLDVPMAEHVERKDFRHGPARKWREVPWVARRTWPTLAEVERWLAERKITSIPEGLVFEERTLGSDDANKDTIEKKAEVWEIWHRERNVVAFVAPGTKEVLDLREPWMHLTGFFPCPRPAYATVQRGTLIPVPDFAYYRDQIEEINEITARVAAMTDALRMRGFYPGGSGDIGEAVEAAMRNVNDSAVLIPVPSLAALGDRSLRDSIVWLPVQEIAGVIVELLNQRKQLIADVYEITGLSDIMRGSTEASETATAQQLKAEFGSVRIRERQNEMSRIARDLIRMKAEVMAEVMPIDALMLMAQIDDIPAQADLEQQAQQIAAEAQQAQQQAFVAAQAGDEAAAQQVDQIAQQAQQQIAELQQQVTREAIEELFASQQMRPFVLDIETDSTIYPDESAEKERRNEFLGAIGPMLQQGVTAMQMAPQLGPFVAEALRFVASGYRAGRQMDDAIDELAEQFASYQPPQEAAGDDPAAAQAEADARMQEAQANIAKMQAEMEIKAQDAAIEREKTGVEIEKLRAEIMKINAEVETRQAEVALNARQADADLARGEREMALSERKADSEMRRGDADADLSERKFQAETRRGEAEAEIKRSAAEARQQPEPKAEEPKKARKTRTRVVKHDDKGRILEIEQEDVD